MKKYFFLSAVAALALASCTSDEYLGEDSQLAGEAPISFSSSAFKTTRAPQSHEASAASLDNNFVVYGWKTTGTDEQVVFDHYNVNYVTNTAHTTASNSADWEYVAQDRVLKGSNPSKQLGNLPATATQEIKYWDMSADQYDFVAFSLGKGVTAGDPATTTYAQVVTKAAAGGDPAVVGVNQGTLTTNAYQLTGSAEQLAASYIADKVTVLKANYGTQKSAAVQFQFRSLGSKVRVGIYETVPGYAVSNIQFYTSADAATAQNAAALYTDGTNNLPAGAGTMTVTIPEPTDNTSTDYNKVHASFTATSASTNVAVKEFGALTLNATAEKLEDTGLAAGTKFLGRESNTATIADVANDNGYEVVLPNEAGVVNGLTLKVKFTLLALDGSGETIEVDGATAVVPQEFTKWQPNYAYTYLFKITDKVSVGGAQALYPITLDAVVVDTEDGVQETITEIIKPSITTYAKGKIVTANDEYTAGSNIYVKVDGATLALTPSANCALYTATVEGGAVQGITEASVANALEYGKAYVVKEVTTGESVDGLYTLVDGTYTACGSTDVAVAGTVYYEANANAKTVVDANGKALTVLTAAGLSIVDKIDATDAPDGNAISGNFAKFTAGAAGTIYVFEYNDGTKKHYKVIKIKA